MHAKQPVGLFLSLYNANVSTDWVSVAQAAARIPIRVVVPVEGVTPPDPTWPPVYPSAAAYAGGVRMLQAAGVEVYAYMHLRNISRPCCTCCGNLTQFAEWVELAAAAAPLNGVYMDNLDSPFSSSQPYHPDGLTIMYEPAAAIVARHGLGRWANGPQVRASSIEGNASAWRPYLELAAFTTLFEMNYADWLAYPAVNFSEALAWPTAKLGGLVLDIPANATVRMLQDVVQLAADRGLSWIYPFAACQSAPGAGCSYASLPAYWPSLIQAFENVAALGEGGESGGG